MSYWLYVYKIYTNKVVMSSLKAPWQNNPYKNKRTEQHKNTQNTKMQQTFIINYFLCFSDVSENIIYDVLSHFSKKWWVTALVRPMTFIGV